MELGPSIEALTRRLSETPPDFLAPPLKGVSGGVNAAAVVSDLIRALGGKTLTATECEPFMRSRKAEARRLSTVMVACWLLYDEWFRKRQRFAHAAYDFLARGLDELAGAVDPEKLVTDPDRREELSRLTLRALDLLPAGEDERRAADRLTTLDSVERQRIVAETQKAQERMRAIQEAMRKKQAEEAAAAWGRE